MPSTIEHNQPHCQLFKLPAEIRLIMYEAALKLETNDAFAFFQSCRDVNYEAQEVLYKRAATFPSQAHFCTWVERSAPHNLTLVKTLHICLTDVDLSAMMDPRASRDPTRRTSVLSISAIELQRLQNCLRALPNLANLTIEPPAHAQEHFWELVYRPLLSSLPRVCRQLQHLELHDNENVLSSVSQLEQVGKVTFLRPMPQPTFESIEERRKSFRDVATVEFSTLLGEVMESRRAVSAPALSRFSVRRV